MFYRHYYTQKCYENSKKVRRKHNIAGFAGKRADAMTQVLK